MKIPHWLKVTLIVLLTLGICFGTWVSWAILVTHPFPLPILVRNLPSNSAEASTVFNYRVKNAFGSGKSETVIITELQKEGFTISPKLDASGYQTATFQGHTVVCNLLWTILWRIGKNSEVLELTGKYESACY